MGETGRGIQDVVRRVRGEFLEMPGLRLTAQQARRLWRLDEIRREEAAIRRAFPDLFGGKGVARAAGVRRRRRSNMSAAARKAVSERMKKYWADRRKKKAGK